LTTRTLTRDTTIKQTGYATFLTFVATGIFIFTAYFIEAAFSGEVAVRASRALSNALKFDVGNALALLRFVQGVLSTFTTLALMQGLELLQWALAGRDNGVSSVGFLGVAPSTTMTGVASIVTSKVARLHERFWGVCRSV
jgi:hypothetical protein